MDLLPKCKPYSKKIPLFSSLPYHFLAVVCTKWNIFAVVFSLWFTHSPHLCVRLLFFFIIIGYCLPLFILVFCSSSMLFVSLRPVFARNFTFGIVIPLARVMERDLLSCFFFSTPCVSFHRTVPHCSVVFDECSACFSTNLEFITHLHINTCAFIAFIYIL